MPLRRPCDDALGEACTFTDPLIERVATLRDLKKPLEMITSGTKSLPVLKICRSALLAPEQKTFSMKEAGRIAFALSLKNSMPKRAFIETPADYLARKFHDRLQPDTH